MSKFNMGGGVRRLGVIFLAISLFVVGMVFGNMNLLTTTYAASIDNENGMWNGNGSTPNGEVCYINYTGRYRLELWGGGHYNGSTWQNGGKIICSANLKKGDILTFRVFAGGTYTYKGYAGTKCDGGKACMFLLNGTPLVGAAGSNGSDYYDRGGFQIRNSPTQTIAGNCGWVNSTINNYYFSAGKAGFSSGSSGSKINAETYTGCISADATGYTDVTSNYLDSNRAKLISMPNDSNLENTQVYFKVETMPYTQEESYDIMASSLQEIAANSGRGSNVTVVLPGDVPVITCCQNQNFSFVVGFYDDIANGTSSDGIVTVTNSNVGDGVIQVSGKFTAKGIYSVWVNGKKFVFNVIENPKTSNVQVILN